MVYYKFVTRLKQKYCLVDFIWSHDYCFASTISLDLNILINIIIRNKEKNEKERDAYTAHEKREGKKKKGIIEGKRKKNLTSHLDFSCTH